MGKEKEVIILYQFDTIIKDFLGKIEALRETLPLVMIFTSFNHIQANKKFAEFLEKYGISEKGEDGEERFTINPEDSHSFKILEKKYNTCIECT